MASSSDNKTILSTREREILYRVYKDYLAESKDVTGSIQKVSLAFQVSERTARRIIEKKQKGLSLEVASPQGRKSLPYDYAFKESLNDVIFSKIKNNQYFNLKIIFEHAKEYLGFEHSKSTLYRLIKDIGYKFKKVDRRKILIEKQSNIISRMRFCAKYMEYKKQNIKFIYLDETWIFQNGSQVRQWVLESDVKGIPSMFKGEGRRYTILNDGTEDGFLPGCDFILDSKMDQRDYHKTMNGELFKKWVTENLIPALNYFDSKFVIIMDNAPYHSIKVEKLPTSSSKKDNIKEWLNKHGIQFDETSTKKQLLDLLRPFSMDENYKKYEIDQILQAEGHEVLRLPPYNCQYNPIELAWGFCKSYYNQRIQGKLHIRNRVVDLWREALQQCTADKWVRYIEHTEKEILDDWEKFMGSRVVDNIPPFIINLESDSEDSDDEDLEEEEVSLLVDEESI